MTAIRSLVHHRGDGQVNGSFVSQLQPRSPSLLGMFDARTKKPSSDSALALYAIRFDWWPPGDVFKRTTDETSLTSGGVLEKDNRDGPLADGRAQGLRGGALPDGPLLDCHKGLWTDWPCLGRDGKIPLQLQCLTDSAGEVMHCCPQIFLRQSMCPQWIFYAKATA